MTGYAGTAIRAALLSFEESLQTITVTRTKTKGLTQEIPSGPRVFSGAIAPASQWDQVISPGGIISSTQSVLVVSSDLVDSTGQALSLSTNDIVIRADGQRMKVLERLDEGERFGVVLYTLTEDLE